MDESQMPSTVEVARRLGSSRQHAVDLCDPGVCRACGVDSHRRVPPTALEDLLRMVGWKFTREQVRSLWLHRALLSALMADPQRACRPSARHD